MRIFDHFVSIYTQEQSTINFFFLKVQIFQKKSFLCFQIQERFLKKLKQNVKSTNTFGFTMHFKRSCI